MFFDNKKIILGTFKLSHFQVVTLYTSNRLSAQDKFLYDVLVLIHETNYKLRMWTIPQEKN